MLKYAETAVVFREVPDEVTLAVNITNCPFRCPSCHSQHLHEDSGLPLDENALAGLISSERGITCVALMGGDSDTEEIRRLCWQIRRTFPHLKTCWYTGRKLDDVPEENLQCLDYIKTGPYVRELGPLDSPTTNQRMYALAWNPWTEAASFTDITEKFRKNPV